MALARQGLIMLGTTVLPIYDHSLSRAVIELGHRSGGDYYDTLRTIMGATPTLTLTTSLKEALTLVGQKCAAYTACTVSLLKFDAATSIVAAAASHVTFTLAASAKAIATLDRISCAHHGLGTATITVHFASSNGTTHPLVKGTGAALSLASQPTLVTLGPVTLNGSVIDGIKSVSADLGHRIEAQTSDGDQYSQLITWFGSSPVISVECQDADAALAATGEAGAAIASTTKVAFYQRAAGIISATQYSIAVGAGTIIPASHSASVDAIANASFSIMCASSDGVTDPWTIGT